jgi:hypothetical protein
MDDIQRAATQTLAPSQLQTKEPQFLAQCRLMVGDILSAFGAASRQVDHRQASSSRFGTQTAAAILMIASPTTVA